MFAAYKQTFGAEAAAEDTAPPAISAEKEAQIAAFLRDGEQVCACARVCVVCFTRVWSTKKPADEYPPPPNKRTNTQTETPRKTSLFRRNR